MYRLILSASSRKARLLSRPPFAGAWKPAQRIKLLSTVESLDNNNNDNSLSSIRTSILKSALTEVHQYGWTEDALAAGTASVKKRAAPNKLSMSVVGMMTVDDLIAFCMDQWNVQLQQDLTAAKEQRIQKKTELSTTTSLAEEEDPLERGIKTRLEYLIPYLQSQRWHEGMALGIRGPSNALQTQRQLQEMVEIIVDSSDDASHLGTPEKMALGAVYVATELHLLTDTSPHYQDTWAFLSSRMEDWRRLTSFSSSSSTASTTNGSASDALFVASSVASSLVGGLASLLMNPSQDSKLASMGLPYAVWSSLFQNPQASWEAHNANTTRINMTDSSAQKDGTHPSDYEVPKRSSQ